MNETMNRPSQADLSLIEDMLPPREYSASRRSLPFGAYKRTTKPNKPSWEMCNGLVAVAKPGRSKYVQYGDLYGVVFDEDFGYTIAQYWPTSPEEWLRRPYTLKTLRKYQGQNKLVELQRGLSYEEMVADISSRSPGIKIPSKRQFFAQFGLPLEEVE